VQKPKKDHQLILEVVTYLFIPLLMQISEENIGLLCHYYWKKETHVYTHLKFCLTPIIIC